MPMNQRQRVQWTIWDGVVMADVTLETMHDRLQHVGAAIAAAGWNCLVAHDNRFLSAHLARYAYRLLESMGVRVSMCPTPTPRAALEYALDQRRAESVLMVAAGNQPHWINGLMVLSPPMESSPFESVTPGITVAAPPFPQSDPLFGERTQVDLRAPYLDMLRSLVDIDRIRKTSLTVIVDAMNGSTSGTLPALVGEGTQTRVIEINRELDPLFGQQVPHPAGAPLNRLRKLVRDSDSHLGVAMSADGRALGVCDNTGDMVPPALVALLLGPYLTSEHRHRGSVVLPVTADMPVPTGDFERLNVRVELANDPPARISEMLTSDRNSLLVGATAMGEFTVGRYGVAPDAALAAILLMELIASSGKKLRALVTELKEQLGTA